MKIHIAHKDERIEDIAKKYGVNQEYLRKTNQIESGEPTEGEELLILFPTRTYKIQFGDTLDKIALRFGVRKAEILQQNPWIVNENIQPGDIISIKTDGKQYGMSSANGYVFSGCRAEQLCMALPYLTYVTFASAITDSKQIKRVIDDKAMIDMVKDAGKIPLVRIYNNSGEILDQNLSQLPNKIIEFAKYGNYKGVVLNTTAYKDMREKFSDFIIELRKLMIGCDLILITEIDDASPIEFSEYSDGSIFYYPKFARDPKQDFDSGERSVLSSFACEGESAKAFIELNAVAQYEGGYCGVVDALQKARRTKCRIEQNESTLLSHFHDKKQGEYCYTSLKSIEETLGLVNEFGYMGVCFDIMRTPLSHMLMYNQLFKTSYYTNVSFREGCNRGVEE